MPNPNIQSNADHFLKQMQGEMKLIEDDIVLELELTARMIQEQVIIRNRIRTGRSKAHWKVSVGSPDFHVDPTIRDDDQSTWITATEAMQQAKRSLEGIQFSMEMPDIYIANGVYDNKGQHYIERLERLDMMAEGTVNWAVTFLPVVITGQIERG